MLKRLGGLEQNMQRFACIASEMNFLKNFLHHPTTNTNTISSSSTTEDGASVVEIRI